MLLLRNKITGDIGYFESPQGDDWIELSPQEALAYQLENAKTAKINQITINRKAFQYSNITIDGQTFVNSEAAQNKFFNLYLGAVAADFPLDWRLADLTWVKLSKDQCLALENAIIAKEKSAYWQETNFIDLVNSCTTLEEVAAINIDFE